MNFDHMGKLRKGQSAEIISIRDEDQALGRRFMMMGIVEGDSVEVVHEAPISKDPFVIRVRGGLLALRRCEAQLIEVKPL